MKRAATRLALVSMLPLQTGCWEVLEATAQMLGAVSELTEAVNEHNEEILARADREKAELLARQVRAKEEELFARERAHALEVQTQLRRAEMDRKLQAEVRRALLQASPVTPDTVVALFALDAGGELDSETARVLDRYLYLRLADDGRVRLVPDEAVKTALREEQRASFRACVDEACQIDVGKALAAEKTLAPVVLRAGLDECVLGLTLYDLRTETAEWAASEAAGCDAEALSRAASRLAARLAGAPGEERSAPPALQATVNPL